MAKTAADLKKAQETAKKTTTATTSTYGGMNYDTYLKSQGQDTGYTPTTTKYAPDGTAYQSSSPTYTGSTQKYASDGTPINTGTGSITGGSTATGTGNILSQYLHNNTPSFLSNLGVVDPDTGLPPGGGGGGGGGGSYRTSSSSGGSNAYKAATLPAATSQADYINTMYDALEAKRKSAFEAEYDARVGALDRQAATIAPQYQQAVNAAAAQSAVSQAAFNERAAAAGINTGAGSQAALAQNNALVSGVSAIRQAESEALADIEKQRVELKTQYQKAIADAIANNEAERAQALYQEAMRVDESIVNTAINQATENFRAWQARYG